jgi:hypothetical protein
MREDQQKLDDNLTKQIGNVLSKKQGATYQKLLGEPFEVALVMRGGPGGRGPGGGPPGSNAATTASSKTSSTTSTAAKSKTATASTTTSKKPATTPAAATADDAGSAPISSTARRPSRNLRPQAKPVPKQ